MWTLDDVDHAWHGEIAEREPALAGVIEAAGLAHSKGMQSYLLFMGVRLLEMRRVLKDTGSIYLHCDPTAGAYLKMVMDAVFGKANFRNEITWKRVNVPKVSKSRFGAVHDVILFYAKSEKSTYNPVYMDYSQEYIDKHFKHKTNSALIG